MAVLSAVSYGASLPLSRLAYDYGSNPLTILTLRFLAIALIVGLWLRVTGASFAVSSRGLLASAVVGVFFVSVSGGTLVSVSYIPVNLTVLIFYTYPMMTLLMVCAMERRRPRVAELAAVSLALLGVALAMQVSFEYLNAVGVAFAFLAAVGAATTFIVAARALPKVGPTLMSWYASSVAFAGGAALTLGLDAVAIPDTAFGIGLIAVILAIFATAVVAMFVSVKLIGPVRSATLLCLEPVTAIFVAVLVLGEQLKAGQWLGAALVGIAMLIASRRPAK
ncbi:MAG: DMT family transporter [Gammaproteobacteria bacterium]|nr:MAG: DMT family transporter [Gammaproteobacteria bacterium]